MIGTTIKTLMAFDQMKVDGRRLDLPRIPVCQRSVTR